MYMQNEQQHSKRVSYCEARLFFTDPKYGLLVESGQSHRTYFETPFGYDHNHCFELADYEKLKAVFLDLTSDGKQCHIWFRMSDANNPDKSLYFGSLNQLEHEGDLWLSSYPPDQSEDFVECEAFLKKPDIAEKVIDLIYGGMLASEIDYLGKDENHQATTPAVQFYRQWEASGMSPSGFILRQMLNQIKRSLVEQIQSAKQTVNAEKGSAEHAQHTDGKER